MTEKDVIGLVNLQSFVKTEKPPTHRSLSAEQVDEMAALLDKTVGSGPNAGPMPVMLHCAAAFWAGLQQDWSSLDAAERQAVRDYIQQMSAKPLSVPLYRRLFGISEAYARDLRSLEETEGARAGMDELRSNMSALGGLMGMWSTIEALGR